LDTRAFRYFLLLVIILFYYSLSYCPSLLSLYQLPKRVATFLHPFSKDRRFSIAPNSHQSSSWRMATKNQTLNWNVNYSPCNDTGILKQAAKTVLGLLPIHAIHRILGYMAEFSSARTSSMFVSSVLIIWFDSISKQPLTVSTPKRRRRIATSTERL